MRSGKCNFCVVDDSCLDMQNFNDDVFNLGHIAKSHAFYNALSFDTATKHELIYTILHRLADVGPVYMISGTRDTLAQSYFKRGKITLIL